MKQLIRRATTSDVPAMMALERQAATTAHWSVEQYETLFRDSGPARLALIVEKDLEVQGFVIARMVGAEWEIENLVIAGPARRHGLGTRLLGELLKRAKSSGAGAVFLEVRASNHAARALYEKWTFTETGSRRRYYQNPEEDAIIYRLEFA